MSRVTSIDSLDDPRIAVYRNLKDRELAREGDRFIAEGEHVVRRLLASDFPVESVLLVARRQLEMAPIVPQGVAAYVVPDALIHQVVGFKFHSGVIACGKRGPLLTMEAMLSRLAARATIVICPEIANTENLGGLMRIAAGFGADAVVLGPECCDPFYRQCIRVSMGAVFSLNLCRSERLVADLKRLRQEGNFELCATVLDEMAAPLQNATRGDRLALLFGNEAQGLSPELLAACDRRVTIPMSLGTDSLNVAVAAAVCLYRFCREL